MFEDFDLVELLEPGQQGNFKLEEFIIDPNNVRAMLDGIPPGRYIKLMQDKELVMSNTPMELRTNWTFCSKAHGDVLIGGLGLGLILLEIQNKPNVNSITVVEKYEDVITLVGDQLPLNDKVNIVHDDIFTYKPKADYDCIYLDIWNYINRDVYKEEMNPLKKRYRKYLKATMESPNRFIACWAENEARNNRKL